MSGKSSSTALDEKLINLLSIPSLSFHEEKIAQHIYKFLKEDISYLNLKHDLNYIGKDNIVCNLKEGNPKIALVGHLDTVPFFNEMQMAPRVESGKIIGRGAADMKAGLACMMQVAEDLLKQETPYGLTLIFYSREERHLPNGLNEVLDSECFNGIDAAIVLEPTGNNYAMGCMGTLTAKVDFFGNSVHSSQPEKGTNAIYRALYLIAKVRNLNDSWLDQPEAIAHGMKFREAISITGINTDNAHNCIPGKCTLTVNYRFSPLESDASIEERFKRLIGVDDKSAMEIKVMDISPSYLIRQEFPIDLREKEKARVIFRAWTDAAQINKAGIPTITYGPGEIDDAHSAYECIKKKDLANFYKDLKILLKLC